VGKINKEQRGNLEFIIYEVEKLSHHPLAGAVVSYFESKKVKFVEANISKFKDVSGKGVKAMVDGKPLLIGTENFLKDHQINVSSEVTTQVITLQQKGQTVSYVALNGEAVAIIAIADAIKDGVVEVIMKLKKMGVTSIMVTGDNQKTAESIAKQAGIDKVLAQVLPADKEEKVQELREGGEVVAFVGDGINDAPALAASDVGIAMGSGTDVAIESAGITLLRSDVSLVPASIMLSKMTMKNIKENLVWAFGYNVILIPVAMGILYPIWGVQMSPILASGAMALSSVSVVTNALRLKKIKL
jgi:Cu+-exporting ATPase